MEIEIVTTKKKLSPSLLKQIPQLRFDEIIGAECLGYVLNIIKDSYKVYLIKLPNGEFRILYYSWYKLTGGKSSNVYRRLKRGTVQLELGNLENVDIFIGYLIQCGKTSQIFI